MVGTNHTFPLQLSESRPQCVTTHLERLAKCTFTRQPIAPVALLDLVAEHGRGLADKRLSPRDRIHGCHGLKTGVRRWGVTSLGLFQTSITARSRRFLMRGTPGHERHLFPCSAVCIGQADPAFTAACGQVSCRRAALSPAGSFVQVIYFRGAPSASRLSLTHSRLKRASFSAAVRFAVAEPLS